MTTFAEIKNEVRADAPAHHRYSYFLKLLLTYDKRGTDAAWDLWFFSQNTDFCLESARYYQAELHGQSVQHQAFQKNVQAHTEFSFDKVRRDFGAFCMYIHAALESFAHEVNLFYEINRPRKEVAIHRIGALLPASATLRAHLESMQNDTDFQFLVEYRNTIVHGYVFPIHGRSEGLFLAHGPRTPIFKFDPTGVELFAFSNRAEHSISMFIKEGWQCFSNDQLLPRR